MIRALALSFSFAVWIAGALLVIVTCVGVYHEAGRGGSGWAMAVMVGLVWGGALVVILASAINDVKKGKL